MRKAQSLSFPVVVHGHAILQSPKRGEGCGLLVGFHGYGENAEKHLEHVSGIPGIDKWWVLAIQALHPFYDRKMENVVACWMTRLNRDQAITGNQEYVFKMVEQVLREIGIKEPLVFEGFSQGVAMAFRAASDKRFKPAGVIALAGDIPPDVIEKGFEGYPPVLMGRGRSDRIIPASKFEADLTTLDWAGVNMTTCEFKGGHTWGEEFCQEAGRFLETVAEG